MTEKAALRRKMQSLRDVCSDRGARDARLLRSALSLPVYQKVSAVLCYVSFGSEADTKALLRQSLLDGKSVFVPRCRAADGEMDFYRIDSMDELSPGKFGILEPPALPERRFQRAENALCFVPGLAFTRSGKRLGYGKGYYDTFLNRIPVCTVGLCYDFQLIEDLPTEEHDKPVSYICTDRGLYRCAQDRKDGLKL